MYGLAAGQDAVVAAETDMEIAPAVAAKGDTGEDCLLRHGMLQGAERLTVRKEGTLPLREIFFSAQCGSPSCALIGQCMR